MKIRSLSTLEKMMITLIVVLSIAAFLQRKYIVKRAGDGMRFLQPVTDTTQEPATGG
ncbi:MAG: hypothetical protein LBK47_06745 [Prevotellaceae bacterium]|jgi:hypothetical protein|nr:hypothetical protein [Prevotellaceae bacterium]